MKYETRCFIFHAIHFMSVQCQECKNEKNISMNDMQVGRWFECDYCGTTYEITSIADDGMPQLAMVEEEK